MCSPDTFAINWTKTWVHISWSSWCRQLHSWSLTFDQLTHSFFDQTLEQFLLPTKNRDPPHSQADDDTLNVLLCVSRRAAPAAQVYRPELLPQADQTENVIEIRELSYSQSTPLPNAADGPEAICLHTRIMKSIQRHQLFLFLTNHKINKFWLKIKTLKTQKKNENLLLTSSPKSTLGPALSSTYPRGSVFEPVTSFPNPGFWFCTERNPLYSLVLKTWNMKTSFWWPHLSAQWFGSKLVTS